MASVTQLLYFLLPVILGGIVNMIFVKLPIANILKIPIDGGLYLKDGERIFGANKTWKGFFGMILFTAIWMGFFSQLYHTFSWARDISLIEYERFYFPFNAWFYGALWGLGYVLFELPNSYIKRRLKIQPGKNGKGLLGSIFLFIDQADSVIGCMVFMLFFYSPALREVLTIFVLGTVIHYLVNISLFLAGLKKQAG